MNADEKRELDAVVGAETTLEEGTESRRRFLKIGLTAAPLLVTLAARPARAQDAALGGYGNYDYGGDDGPPDDMMDDKKKKNKKRRRLNRNR